MNASLTILLFIWALAMLVGGLIGSSKGRAGEGFVWAMLLGWIGVIIVAFLSKAPSKLIEEARQREYAERIARGQLPPYPPPYPQAPPSPGSQPQPPDTPLTSATARAGLAGSRPGLAGDP